MCLIELPFHSGLWMYVIINEIRLKAPTKLNIYFYYVKYVQIIGALRMVVWAIQAISPIFLFLPVVDN